MEYSGTPFFVSFFLDPKRKVINYFLFSFFFCIFALSLKYAYDIYITNLNRSLFVAWIAFVEEKQ